jgi:hypothetical protein
MPLLGTNYGTQKVFGIGLVELIVFAVIGIIVFAVLGLLVAAAIKILFGNRERRQGRLICD